MVFVLTSKFGTPAVKAVIVGYTTNIHKDAFSSPLPSHTIIPLIKWRSLWTSSIWHLHLRKENQRRWKFSICPQYQSPRARLTESSKSSRNQSEVLGILIFEIGTESCLDNNRHHLFGLIPLVKYAPGAHSGNSNDFRGSLTPYTL
jgi:hypothetical protein